MSSVYTASPVALTDLTIPSDGDAPIQASDVNPSFEGLADAVKHGSDRLDAIELHAGQISALNWPVQYFSGGVLTCAHYNQFLRRWFAFGTANNARSTDDWGQGGWSDLTPIGGAAGENMLSVAGTYGSNGVMCISTNTRYVFNYDGAGTFSRVDAYGAAGPTFAIVVYDPIRSKFVWICPSVAGVFKCKRSSDRVTWTNATTPPTGTWENIVAADVNPTTGRIVVFGLAAAPDSGAHCATSDDGGDTWTMRADPASSDTGGAADQTTGVTYNAFDDTWLAVVGFISLDYTELHRSTDGGVTWSNPQGGGTHITTAALDRAAPNGKVWCARRVKLDGSTANEGAYSIDGGATWRRADTIRLLGIAHGVYAGGGGFCAPGNAGIALSLRTGKPGTVMT